MNRRGVTLIELIIVMVIIAIGAVLVAPNIGAWLPNYRLKGASRDVVSTMRTAQMKAVSTNLPYRVSFTAGSYVLQRNTGGAWVDEGGAQSLPAGINVSTGFAPQFNPNSTASSGTVTLQNSKGARKTITVTSATGRINLN